MAQSLKNYCIEPLNGNNYHSWKFRMEVILAENDVLEQIEGEVDMANMTRQDKANHIKKENKAKSLIIQCVNDLQLETLREKKVFMKCGRLSKKSMKRKVYRDNCS